MKRIFSIGFNVFMLAIVCTMFHIDFEMPDIAFLVCIIGSIFIALDICDEMTNGFQSVMSKEVNK